MLSLILSIFYSEDSILVWGKSQEFRSGKY